MERRITPIVLGTIEADKSGFTYMCFPGEKIVLEVTYFLIEGAPKVTLVDTGSWAELMAKFWPGQGVDFQTFEESLEKKGLKPEDVEIIIQTHLHHDHCGNTSKCKNAEVYVQEAEWIFMQAPHPLQAQYYPKELYKGWKVRLIKGDHELFPGLTILHTAGHTPGTQSVLVETKEGRAVIPGFCCTTHTFQNPADTLPEGHPFANWETFVPAIATDLSEAYSSTLRLKTLADIMLPCHGPGYDERTKKFL
ncbi:MAG: N-acyl homoserine lactonase family protein [Deltaproteobacteria bacterium]|nr:MAG: N-acyl homoserine lactonase family protein [Deltaproteobacteria bacterium]